MFSNILHRPILAIVISIVIVFLGALAINQLPTSQFPEIAPTTVNVSIAYPGASADVLVKSTLIPLELAINGVQGMRYLATDATSAGEATIRIIFEPGTDPSEAVVRVKTRVDQVMPLLPILVQREGVILTPIQPSMLMYVNLYSTDKSADEKFLFNYVNVKMVPEIRRIRGIAAATKQLIRHQFVDCGDGSAGFQIGLTTAAPDSPLLHLSRYLSLFGLNAPPRMWGCNPFCSVISSAGSLAPSLADNSCRADNN